MDRRIVDVDDLVDCLLDRLDEDVRKIFTYDEHLMKLEYIRSDISLRTDGDESEWIHRRIVQRTSEIANLNDELDWAQMHSQVSLYDDMTLFFCFSFPCSGVVVELEPDANPDVATLRDVCQEWTNS